MILLLLFCLVCLWSVIWYVIFVVVCSVMFYSTHYVGRKSVMWTSWTGVANHQPSWCCWTANVACREWSQNKAKNWRKNSNQAGVWSGLPWLVIMFSQPALHDSGADTGKFPVLSVALQLHPSSDDSLYILYTVQFCPASHTGKMSSNRKLQSGVIYHPVLGYPIPPPVPVAVARRNARERSRVKTVNDSYQHLKNHVPGAARQKRMSKVDIIKHSIDYIQRLRRSLQDSELPASDEANHPGDLEERLTPCSGDSGYQSQSQSQSHSQSPHYNYYKHSPSSTSSSSSSSSSFSSLPGAAHQPSPGLQTDCDVLDAIMEWQDDCESWLSLFLLRNKLISTLLSLSL